MWWTGGLSRVFPAFCPMSSQNKVAQKMNKWNRSLKMFVVRPILLDTFAMQVSYYNKERPTVFKDLWFPDPVLCTELFLFNYRHCKYRFPLYGIIKGSYGSQDKIWGTKNYRHTYMAAKKRQSKTPIWQQRTCRTVKLPQQWWCNVQLCSNPWSARESHQKETLSTTLPQRS